MELDHQSRLMTALVEDVVARGELSPLLVLAERLRCVEVHPDHLRGDLFGTWANRYGDFPEPGGDRPDPPTRRFVLRVPRSVRYVGSTVQGRFPPPPFFGAPCAGARAPNALNDDADHADDGTRMDSGTARPRGLAVRTE